MAAKTTTPLIDSLRTPAPAPASKSTIGQFDRADLQPEHALELVRCAQDFRYWLTTYLRVPDTRQTPPQLVPFEPWSGQSQIIETLEGGGWVCAPKARRLGVTFITLARILWECCYRSFQDAALISQKEQTAISLMGKYKMLEGTLPRWMVPGKLQNSDSVIRYGRIEGRGVDAVERFQARVQVYIGNQGAARSEGLTAAFIDEAAYVQDLGSIISGVEPGVESSGGWIVVASSTSSEKERPVSLDAFRQLYYSSVSGETKFRALFLDPWERPDRDLCWWDREERTHRHIAGYMQREYPRSADEAFSKSGGQVFPSLSKQDHFVSKEEGDAILRREGVQLFRSIDFGDSQHSCFVCSWLAHDSSGPPRLLFVDGSDEVLCSERGSRGFPNGYDELLNYRRDPVTNRLEKRNDNVADALRYAITMWRMRGTVLVYRLLFVRQDDDFQLSPIDIFQRVLEMSGFAETGQTQGGIRVFGRTARTESYVATVCDRSAAGWIKLLRDQRAPVGMSIDAVKYDKPEEFTRDEREQGCVWLKALIMGDAPWEIVEEQDPTEEIRKRYEEGLPSRDLNEHTKYAIWRAQDRGRASKDGGDWAGMRVPMRSASRWTDRS